VKNLTVTIPDSAYRAARIKAAESGTSVSALVTAFLTGLDTEQSRFDRLAAQQDAIVARLGTFRAADRLTRGEAHDRAIR
jgi:plasmid stability protein